MEKIGIIDLGSNSARLVIVNLFADGYFMVVDELKESVRLGQDMERDGFLKPARVAETIKTLKMFRKLCDASGVHRIIAVATEAVRRAKNQRSFLDEIQATCGIKIRVLTAEEEAVFVYRPDRLCDLLDAMRGSGIEPKRVTSVCADCLHAPSMVLVSGKKGGAPGLYFSPIFFISELSGEKTQDYEKLMEEGFFDERYRNP